MIFAYSVITGFHIVEVLLKYTFDSVGVISLLTLIANFILDLCTIGVTLHINMKTSREQKLRQEMKARLEKPSESSLGSSMLSTSQNELISNYHVHKTRSSHQSVSILFNAALLDSEASIDSNEQLNAILHNFYLENVLKPEFHPKPNQN